MRRGGPIRAKPALAAATAVLAAAGFSAMGRAEHSAPAIPAYSATYAGRIGSRNIEITIERFAGRKRVKGKLALAKSDRRCDKK